MDGKRSAKSHRASVIQVFCCNFHALPFLAVLFCIVPDVFFMFLCFFSALSIFVVFPTLVAKYQGQYFWYRFGVIVFPKRLPYDVLAFL